MYCPQDGVFVPSRCGKLYTTIYLETDVLGTDLLLNFFTGPLMPLHSQWFLANCWMSCAWRSLPPKCWGSNLPRSSAPFASFPLCESSFLILLACGAKRGIFNLSRWKMLTMKDSCVIYVVYPSIVRFPKKVQVAGVLALLLRLSMMLERPLASVFGMTCMLNADLHAIIMNMDDTVAHT